MKQEAEFNSVLGAALEKSNPACRGCMIVEETGVLAESAGLKPDVLIVHKSSPPISIETSFSAGDADQDALARLGKHHESTMEEIKTSISVELKPAFRKVKRLTGQRLQYAVHQLLPGGEVRRFPKTGFIEGTHHDLARIAQDPEAASPGPPAGAEPACTRIRTCARIAPPRPAPSRSADPSHRKAWSRACRARPRTPRPWRRTRRAAPSPSASARPCRRPPARLRPFTAAARLLQRAA